MPSTTTPGSIRKITEKSAADADDRLSVEAPRERVALPEEAAS
ncbi:uncharacterized protein SOCEGT47_083190 [Sorangium cellulosum]|uniref:Uncharacterized protein n=1 Tax=Sorangium cellulosum TaxID=56 RepID=A0A4P2QE57_SORCE|nr:hypothetical protein [Sorangium cellulosum]AUX27721.1 uncharacterized protein SOCEGT47_083190 [Sorangium cellulosum]